jgi:hypothetical protein
VLVRTYLVISSMYMHILVQFACSLGSTIYRPDRASAERVHGEMSSCRAMRPVYKARCRHVIRSHLIALSICGVWFDPAIQEETKTSSSYYNGTSLSPPPPKPDPKDDLLQESSLRICRWTVEKLHLVHSGPTCLLLRCVMRLGRSRCWVRPISSVTVPGAVCRLTSPPSSVTACPQAVAAGNRW